MHKQRSALTALLAVAVLLLTACGGRPAPEPQPAAPTLEDVRRQAQAALDVSLSSQQREDAREGAVATLVTLLRQPSSTAVAKAEWEQPFGNDSAAKMSYFADGKNRAYGLSIPASGVVPPGERVVAQYLGAGGNPQASEVPVMPGGQLMGAQSVDETGLLLIFRLVRGGGYVAHYVRDSKTGEFKPEPAVFRSIPPVVGDTRLELRGNFLVADLPLNVAWAPHQDKNKPQKLFLTADIGLEWKGGRFELLDERSYTAFEGFVTAANAATPKAERTEAWEKATAKLPAYLQTAESLIDPLTGKLPKDSQVLHGQGGGITVRVVSIPPIDGVTTAAFTAIQHRVGNGLPMAQAVSLPGLVESFYVVNREGRVGLILLTAGQTPQSPKQVTLLRVTGANDWELAPDWFGFLPPEPGITFDRPAGTANLVINGANQVSLRPDAGVNICKAENDCFALTWTGAKLSGSAGWLGARLQQPDAAKALSEFLAAPEAAGLTAVQVATAVGANLTGWDLSTGTRVFALPTNTAGVAPVVIQHGKAALVETTAPGAVTQWLGIREVLTGTDRWMLLLGRTPQTASLLLYRWNGETWLQVDPLGEHVSKVIGEWTSITYTPGQKNPVRGIYVTGATDLKANFAPDGSGVAFCEAWRPCTTFLFDQRWVLK